MANTPLRSPLFSIFVLFLVTGLHAQQKEGRVVYARTVQMNVQISGSPGIEAAMPKSRTDRFELNFAAGHAGWKLIPDLQTDEGFSGPGVSFRVMQGGADDYSFFDLENSVVLEQREFAGKKYLVRDSLGKNNWKLTGQTKPVLGRLCQEARTTIVSKRTIASMENGKMTRTEISDTSETIAWFTPGIPVAAGPMFQGQLPGMILELSTNKGRTVYLAEEISDKPAKDGIREPSKGKKITRTEFDAERSKIMEEQQKQGGGFRTVIVAG